MCRSVPSEIDLQTFIPTWTPMQPCNSVPDLLGHHPGPVLPALGSSQQPVKSRSRIPGGTIPICVPRTGPLSIDPEIDAFPAPTLLINYLKAIPFTEGPDRTQTHLSPW